MENESFRWQVPKQTFSFKKRSIGDKSYITFKLKNFLHKIFRASSTCFFSFIILLTCLLSFSDTWPNEYSCIQSYSELDSLITFQKNRLQEDYDNCEKRIQLVQLLMKRGNWEEAERELSVLFQQKPANNKLLLLFGHLYRRTYRFPEAENIFRELLQRDKNNREARLALADLFIIKKNIFSADSLITELLKADSLDSQAWTKKAYISYLLSLNADALQFYKRAILIAPDNSHALTGLARMFFDESRLDSSKKYINRALHFDYYNSDAHTLLGYVYFREGNIYAAGDELRLALKSDRFNLQAHRMYGQGITDKQYSPFQYPAEFEKASTDAGKILQQAWSAFEQTDYENSQHLFQQLIQIDSTNIFGWLGLGSIAWLQGELDRSLIYFNKILEQYPDYGTAHNGVSRVLASKIDQYSVDFEKSIQLLSKIPLIEFPSLREVFTNYATLSTTVQKSILFSISPLVKYLPALDSAEATFYILPLHEKLTDAESRKFLRGVRTFDLRLWDDIRGNGGQHATSCIGSCWDALHFKFNEIAHEFAHQVHIFALTQNEKETIQNLFYQALAENKCLDVYARSDEYEYFAVGVEAYVSQQKQPDQKLYHGHTHLELARKDPELFHFIEYLSNKAAIRENILSARVHRAENFLYAGQWNQAISTSEKVLKDEARFIPAFHTLGQALMLKDEIDQAINIFRQAVNINKEEASSWKWLAIAQYIKTGNINTTKSILLKGITHDRSSAELYYELAKLEQIQGNLAAAKNYFLQASKINPTFYDAYCGAAHCFFKQGYHKEAIELLNKVFQSKREVKALFIYGEILLKQEKLIEAQQVFQSAATVASDNKEIQAYLSHLECRLNDPITGITEQIALIDSNKNNLKILNILLQSLYLTRRWEETEKFLHGEEILLESKKEKRLFHTKNPYQNEIPVELISEFYFYKGLILSRTHRQKEALKAFQKSIEIFPLNFDAYLELIHFYKQQNNNKLAKKYLKKMHDFKAGPFYSDQYRE